MTVILPVRKHLTKIRAVELFEDGLLGTIEIGTFAGLVQIHRYLFQDVYDFAGCVREVNIAKGNFRFALVLYLASALEAIDHMPQTTFDEILTKYVEMDVAHPFHEGNGRSTRLWLDALLKRELGQVVDWSCIDKEDYLFAMERSPVRDTELCVQLSSALTDDTTNRQVNMKGIDASYRYEGYGTYTMDELDDAKQ